MLPTVPEYLHMQHAPLPWLKSKHGLHSELALRSARDFHTGARRGVDRGNPGAVDGVDRRKLGHTRHPERDEHRVVEGGCSCNGVQCSTKRSACHVRGAALLPGHSARDAAARAIYGQTVC